MSEQHKPKQAFAFSQPSGSQPLGSASSGSASSGAYRGDVLPSEAWAALASDAKAQLVDVRTAAEWAYVGVSDLSGLAKKPILLEWQVFPQMSRNERFEEVLRAELIASGATPDIALYFICRSGVRSRAAAIAMTAAGFLNCFNIAGGFEGDPDETHHRGVKNGWKAESLPWRQG